MENKPDEWAIRLSIARGFAVYLQSLDPATEVPPADLLPRKRRRADPYLYTEAEIAALMDTAKTLRFPLNRATYQTVIGLLASTGMRIGELIALDRDDLDQKERTLLVRNAKFADTRLLVLHRSTVEALGAYAALRDELWPEGRTPAFFISTAGAGWRSPTSRRPSAIWCGPPASKLARSVATRASTTSGTAWSWSVWSTGTAKAPTSRPSYRPCLPISATRARLSPSGTSRRPRSCSPLPPLAASRSGGAGDDPARAHVGGVLHAQADRPAPGSAHTVASYRDTFKLLLGFAAERTGRAPSRLQLKDLDAPLIGAFLDHLRRSGQRRAHPQRPPRRGALDVPLRCPATSRARRPHRSGARHPAKAH